VQYMNKQKKLLKKGKKPEKIQRKSSNEQYRSRREETREHKKKRMTTKSAGRNKPPGCAQKGETTHGHRHRSYQPIHPVATGKVPYTKKIWGKKQRPAENSQGVRDQGDNGTLRIAKEVKRLLRGLEPEKDKEAAEGDINGRTHNRGSTRGSERKSKEKEEGVEDIMRRTRLSTGAKAQPNGRRAPRPRMKTRAQGVVSTSGEVKGPNKALGQGTEERHSIQH